MVDFSLINKIRNHINRTEKQAQLLANRQKWGKVTSALNVLEDTSWAIEYYTTNDYPEDVKGKYLFTYGLLQALFVQQDAISSIYSAFFDKRLVLEKTYPEAYKVREMRNDVVGHPTTRHNDREFIYLAQISMQKDGFYYEKRDSNNGKSETIHVNVIKAIEQVAQCVNSVMESVDQMLNEEFMEYIEQHRDRKMRDIFKILSYAKEKALGDVVMGDWGYNATKEMVKNCENELILRYGSLDTLDEYSHLLSEIREVYDLIDSGVVQTPAELQAGFRKYLLQILFSKLEELESYTEETDRYFENYGDESAGSVPDSKKVVIVFEGTRNVDLEE